MFLTKNFCLLSRYYRRSFRREVTFTSYFARLSMWRLARWALIGCSKLIHNTGETRVLSKVNFISPHMWFVLPLSLSLYILISYSVFSPSFNSQFYSQSYLSSPFSFFFLLLTLSHLHNDSLDFYTFLISYSSKLLHLCQGEIMVKSIHLLVKGVVVLTNKKLYILRADQPET